MNDDEPGMTATPGNLTRRRRATALLLAPAVLFFVLRPDTAAAQQWLVTPELEIAAQYVDNPRLREDGEEPGTGEDGLAGPSDSIEGGLIDAALALRRNTPVSTFLLRPSVVVQRYAGETDKDAEAYLLDMDAGREGRRSGWRLRGNYRQEQVFRGETTPADFDDLLEDDVQTGTGRTFQRRQRDLWRIQPEFRMSFTELTALALELRYQDVSYDEEEPGTAVDYRNMYVDAAIQRELSPYNRLEFAVFGSRYDPSIDGRETDAVGARIGYQQSTSDISTWFVEVGAQATRRDSLR